VRSEEVQLTSFKDQVFHQNQDFFLPSSNIDYTNNADNLTTITGNKVILNNHLYIYGNSLEIVYTTSKKLQWTDVLSNTGGMQSTIASPVAFLIAIWLYGTSLACLQFEGKAPLDPLPDDFLKRVDVYFSQKVLAGELRAGAGGGSDKTEGN